MTVDNIVDAVVIGPALPIWITRDTYADGTLDPEVEVWSARPTRLQICDDGGWFWTTENPDEDLIERVPLADAAAWSSTLPTTERECVRVG